MNKGRILLLLLFLQCVSYAQTNKEILIMGTVTDCHTKKTIYKDLYVEFFINDSTYISTPLNSSGQYSFRTGLKTLSGNQCNLYVIQDHTASQPVDSNCSSFKRTAYVMNGYMFTPPFKDTVLKDLCLEPMPKGCFKLNEFFFEKNSTGFVTNGNNTDIDKGLVNAGCIILEDKIKVEVSGYADSKETDALELSIKRGEVIKEKLMKMGVPDSMMVVKGYGASHMLTKAKEQKKLPAKEIEAARERNRRVSFRILVTGAKRKE